MNGLPAAAAHPLVGSLAWAAGPLPYWPAQFGLPRGPAEWRPYPSLLSVDAVGALLADVDATLRGGTALAAQTLVGQVAGPVLGVLSAVLFAERRLALVEPEQIMFRFPDGEPAGYPALALVDVGMLALPDDPAIGRPGVTVVTSLADLQRALIDQSHRLFEPFVDVVSHLGRRGRRALWQGLADRIAIGFLQAGKHVDAVDRARAEAEATLGGAAIRPLRLTIDWLEVEHTEGTEWFNRKSVCCLHYKSAVNLDQHCATCPLLPREQSIERLGALHGRAS